MSSTGQILTLRLDKIRVPPHRLRALKPDQARAVGAAIATDGQYDPIAVAQLQGQPGYELVDGLHRLEGSRLEGLPTIEARLAKPERRMRVRREALSGIVRATEDVFDRAAAIDALAKIAREDAGVPSVMGIDAPEMPGHCRAGRACTPGDGHRSKAVLAGLVATGQVSCQPSGFDRYGRTLARCSIGTVDLGCELIRAGAAVERYRRVEC